VARRMSWAQSGCQCVPDGPGTPERCHAVYEQTSSQDLQVSQGAAARRTASTCSTLRPASAFATGVAGSDELGLMLTRSPNRPKRSTLPNG
jgi:hypothetical protein